MELSEPPARAPLFKREPIDLGEVLLQGVAVLLGVLAALAIDNWRERRQDAQIVQAARVSIATELRDNATRVGAHAALATQAAQRMARANARDAGDRPCSGYAGWAGAQPPMLNDTAYQVAIATQAFSKMPYAQAARIGEAYGQQRFVGDMYRKAVDMLLLPQAVPVTMCIGIQREMALGGGQAAKRFNATADALAKTP